MSNIINLWSRLEAWASTNAPEVLSDLSPGATADELHLLESQLGLTLPDSFKSSLAVHNGEDDGWPCRVFINRGAYLSTTGILEEWRRRQQLSEDFEEDSEELIESDEISVDSRVQPKMFLTSWVPFLECNGDIFWAMDFAPAAGGKVGQVIEVDWECGSRRVVADSFADFLDNYVTALEQGDYDDAVAARAVAPEMALKHKAVLRKKFVFGSVVLLIGLYLVTRSSGPIGLSLGLLVLVWGGLIIRSWLTGRGMS